VSVRKKLCYTEFVEAVANKNIIFQLKSRKVFSNYPLSPIRRELIRILAILMFLPIAFIPLICYLTHTWFLLLGFVGAYIGLVIAGINNKTSDPQHSFRSLSISSGFLFIGFAFFLGFLNIITFITFCYFYEFISVAMNDIVHTYFIKDSLLNSPSDYETAVENELIITYLKH
jgi:hypothetical protein